MVDKQHCIILTGHRWFKRTLDEFYLKINNKIRDDPNFLAKLVWWFENAQLNFTRAISAILSENKDDPSPLYGRGGEFEKHFAVSFDRVFGTIEPTTVTTAICPDKFLINQTSYAEGRAVQMGKKTNSTEETDDEKTDDKQAPHDFVRRRKKIPYFATIGHNKRAEDVFDPSTPDGRANCALLPKVTHHHKSAILSRPCIRYHWGGSCQRGNDCEYSHRELWRINKAQKRKVIDAMKTINAKLV